MPPVAEQPRPAPQLGVIRDARARRRARRTRALLTGGLAILIAGAALLAAQSFQSSRHAGGAPPAALASAAAAGFEIRIWPTLTVGRTGWCMVAIEHGRPGGSVCGGPADGPFVEVWGWGEAGKAETEVAVTAPSVRAIRLGAGAPVATRPLPGLPYGLRAARTTGRTGAVVTAIGSDGRGIPAAWSRPPRQALTRSWRYPARAPGGVCTLTAPGLPGHDVRGGTVSLSMRPFPGRLIGSAFLPCASTRFELRRVPLQAFVLVDAAHPGGPVAPLPDFRAVSGHPGSFTHGGLLARRSGAGWIVVEQGSSSVERARLLQALRATVHA